MNRIVLFGLSTFFSLVGIGLLGSPKPARAGHGIFVHGWYSVWNPCGGCHGCYGYNGYHAVPSCCHGCYGCNGYHAVPSCCHGCSGCYRSAGCHGCHGCYGCSGGQACSGSCYGYGTAMPVEAPVEPAPFQPSVQPVPMTSPAPIPAETRGASMGQRDASAELVVRVPADARLFVDDQATRTTGTVRRYRSPQLAASATYEYELRAEITRDGQTTTQSKIVRVTAGTSQEIDFELDSPQTVLVSHP